MLEVTEQRPINNENANAWISKLSPVTLRLMILAFCFRSTFLRDQNDQHVNDDLIAVNASAIKPGFHLQQTPRPRHKKQSDYVLEQSSFPLIALFLLKIGRSRDRNWLYGNQA